VCEGSCAVGRLAELSADRPPRRARSEWFPLLKALHKRVHALALHLLHEHTEPSRMAVAVWVGCVVGCTPLFGLHLWVCIALAWLLRLNQVVVYAAANISIPPIAPFIGFAAVQLGERVLHGRWMAMELADFTWRNAPTLGARFFTNWLLGGVMVGAAVGLVGAAITWVTLTRRRARKLAEDDPVYAAVQAASARYHVLPRRLSVYARMKYRMDPCYRAIAAQVPTGSYTVDLGTGLGMLPMVLGELGEGRKSLGVDWDSDKLPGGIQAAAGLEGVELIERDIRTLEIPSCDVITLVDVLHYYDPEAQRALLTRCANALRPGGRLLIREGDKARAGGARITRLIERLVTRLGWNRAPAVHFRPAADLQTDLNSLGFTVQIAPLAGQLHPGNVLLVAKSPPQPNPSANPVSSAP
jgi:uncharacterized protein (DUF2062 family)/2-polyprenyl-3-methyl-5-hydroxy-6-metoxy-1,4-benzoquinol methylase